MAYAVDSQQDTQYLVRNPNYDREDIKYFFGKMRIREERQYINKIEQARVQVNSANRALVVVAVIGEKVLIQRLIWKHIVDQGVALKSCNHRHAVMMLLNFSSADIWKQIYKRGTLNRLAKLNLDMVLLAVGESALHTLAVEKPIAACNMVENKIRMTVHKLQEVLQPSQRIMQNKPRIMIYLPRQG